MSKKITIGISACLLGQQVRYDGGHKLDHYFRDTLGQFVEWVPVCPEVESGLSVPREAMQLVSVRKRRRLITVSTGVDHTDRVLLWSRKKLAQLRKIKLCGFVFKSRSPSCAVTHADLFSLSGRKTGTVPGIFAKAFREHFPLIPVEEENSLQAPGVRENFFERGFVYSRWLELLEEGWSIGPLVAFHSGHKLLIMSHSIKHLRELGLIVANTKQHPRPALFEKYAQLLMEGLRLRATVSKHTNVLQLIAGYFRMQLSSVEKIELQKVIAQYHTGLVPLIVPITILKQYAGKHNELSLRGQHYLNPNPLEVMLRNHV
jgi:uncharacterized protein YbgA (DUF1722 family)/uncharacterized protein YbbK (DUF523 family)